MIQPVSQPAYWIARDTSGAIIHQGVTHPGEITVSGLELLGGEGEDAFFDAVAAVDPGDYDPIPDVGQWCEHETIYGYNGGFVICRQSHTRMAFTPEETPALWLVYRPAAVGPVDWIVGESVDVGTQRTYNAVVYEAIQAHVTQADWTPPATPALWGVVATPTDQWAVGVAYAVGDHVMYEGLEYKCLQAHTSIATWYPPIVPALWLPL